MLWLSSRWRSERSRSPSVSKVVSVISTTDRLRRDGLGEELHTVIHGHSLPAFVPEARSHVGRFGRAVTQQVHVSGRAVFGPRPCHEQHGALEDEAITVFRQRESEEEPFQAVEVQDSVEGDASGLRHGHQALSHGGGDVPDIPAHPSAASR